MTLFTPTTPQNDDHTLAAAITRACQMQPGDTPRSAGTRFENLVAAVLPRLPEYELTHVARYADWQTGAQISGYSPHDRGIDLIGQLADGEFIAIQCKAQQDKIRLGDIATFLAKASKPMHWRHNAQEFRFAALFLVTAGGEVTPDAAEELQGHKGRIINLPATHGDFSPDGKQTAPPRQPNEKQQAAIRACLDGFAANERGRLVMACGTGKTYTALRVTEQLGAPLVLFAAPSIALVGQARREWLRHKTEHFSAMVVCSDSTAGRGEANNLDEVLLESPVTRHAGNIAAFMKASAADGRRRVLFCTYQSLDKVRAAQQAHAAPAFNLAIIDEAHRTTGVETPASAQDKWAFQDIHADANIRIEKRLYMTATPRIYTPASKNLALQKGAKVYDMNDVSVYGPLFYRLKFRDAINARDKNGDPLLCDYRLIVLLVPQKDTPQDLRQRLREDAASRQAPARKNAAAGDLMRQVDRHITRIYGVAQAINGEIIAAAPERPHRLRRVIGFCNTVRNSGFYADSLQDPALLQKVAAQLPAGQPAVPIQARHLDAKSNAMQRAAALSRLNAAQDDACQTLCNVGLFNEGVDVPALDAVVFFEPRKSQVDVVQSVGRVMRRAPGKKLGYIIIPAAVPDNMGDISIDNIISQDEEGYAAILQTLRALQSHDERLVESPAKMINIVAVKPPVDNAPEPEQDLHDATEARESADTLRTQRQLEIDLRAASLQGVTDDILAAVVQKSGLGNAGKLTADDIESAVKAAAKLLFNAGAAPALAGAVGAAAASKQEQQAACIIAALILANACLLHKRLAALPAMQHLRGLQNFGAQPHPLAALQTDWRAILQRDYKPIFEPALAVLDALAKQPDHRHIALALQRIAECANSVADSLSDLGYDHAGPLYHKILGTAESDGAFYTTNTAALLLAKLALPPNFTDWADAQKIAALRIMDPACGTGTLLMAALKTIKEQASAAQGMDAAGQKALHKSLVENTVCGLDINHQAVQIAASNLTLGAPDVDYTRMNMYTMQHGIDAKGNARAGSLELLTGGDLSHFTRQTHTLQSAAAAQVDDSAAVDFPVRDLDMVIMNPPYSNNTKRSARFSAADKKKMQTHELRIKADAAAHLGKQVADVIDSNAISTFFMPLTESMINKQNGTLAMVRAATTCTGTMGTQERKYLADHFHIELLITSHTKTGFNFSGKTDIHECLLVARRHGAKGGGTCCLDTQIVVLSKMPQNSKDVDSIVAAINNGDMGDWGAMHRWPADRMQAGDWSPVQWYNGELPQAALKIQSNPALHPLHSLLATGALGRRILENFEKCDSSDEGAVPILWSKSTKLHTCIQTTAMEYGRPQAGREAKAAHYGALGGHVLLIKGYDTMSGTLTALYSDSPAIGSGWQPIVTQTREQAMALAVWWNSTISLINLLNQRSRKLTWPLWSVESMRSMPIPDLSDDTVVQTLLDAFNQVRHQPLGRLKDAANDPARTIIDEAAAQVSGIPANTLHHWRALLSQEPTINPNAPN